MMEPQLVSVLKVCAYKWWTTAGQCSESLCISGGAIYIDGSCAGLVSTVVWLSQINRQEQSDGIGWRLYLNALMKMLKIKC